MAVRRTSTIDKMDRKLALSFGALTLVLMLMVTIVSSVMFINLQSKEENRLSGALAQILGESISKVSFSGKYHARIFVEEIKAKVPGIEAISVESREGVVIASSDPLKNDTVIHGNDLEMVQKSLLRKEAIVAEGFTGDNQAKKIIVIPYGGGIDHEIIGVVRLVVNFEKARKDQKSGFIWMLFVATALSIVALFAIFILSRYFGSAVRGLAAQLQAILDNSPALIYMKDLNGRYQFVNRAWYELFNKTTESVTGKTDLELFPEDSAREFMTNDRNALESGKALDLEEHVMVAGTLRCYHSIKVAIHDNEKNYYGLCGISTDITERKHAEKELSISRNMLAYVMDSIPQTIFWKDRNSIYLGCNKLFAQRAGYQHSSDIIGKTDFDLPWNKEESEAYRADDRAVIENYQVKRHIIETQRQIDGTTIWVDTTKIPLTDDTGLVYGILGVYEDISERKLVEEAMRQSEEKFSKAFDKAPILMSITRLQDGTYLEVNDKFCATTGFSREDAIGKNSVTLGLLSPENRQLLLDEVAKKGHVSSIELPLMAKDGKEIRAIISGELVTINNWPCLLSIALDITEQRNLEEQLLQSQKMEGIGQLAGGVAHDFNNILQVIMGYCSLLEMDTKLDEFQQENVKRITSSAEKAVQLTSGLLAFSRKQVMNVRNVNLNDIVQHAQKFLVRIIGEDIQLQSHVHEVILPVSVDSGQIEQVLINLATNARDAMPKGGVLSIETGLQEIDSSVKHIYGDCVPGHYAWIGVSDTGSGMAEETCKRIFDPFFTTKEVGKGTGLGLSIVYGIVKQHNGFIDVHSIIGQGTTFRFYIPIDTTDQSEQRVEKTKETPQGGSETILLAEDDPSVRKLMFSVLTKFGYDVIQAEDGQEAVEKFSTNHEKIRLILMDMIMPKKNGKEAYEEIIRMVPGVKVLFLSGYTAEFIQNRGVSEEGISLIMKPVQPMELLRKVRDALDE